MLHRWLSIALLVTILAAACGGGGEGSATADPTATPDPVETPEPAEVEDQATATPAPTPLDQGDQDGAGDGDGDPGPATTPTPLPEPTLDQTPTPPPAAAGPIESVVVAYDSDSFGFEQTVLATLARDGSFRLDYEDGSIEVLDAATSTRTSYFLGGDDLSVIVDSGLGLGGPDAYWKPFLPGFERVDHVLALAGTAFAGQGEVLGRDAVLYEASVVPNGIGGGPDRITVAVDAETGAILDYRASFEGQEQSSLVATSFEVFTDRLDVFTLPDLPAPTFSYDQGFQRPTIDQITGLVGYTPLLPAVVPDGYTLDAVAVVPGQSDIFTGAEGSNPPSIDIVHARYRNGWRTVTVATRRVGDQPDFWIDPFSGEGQFYERFEVEVTGGSFAGQVAELSTAPETVPHVWLRSDEFVVTVTGPLRDFELIDIVNSLGPA